MEMAMSHMMVIRTRLLLLSPGPVQACYNSALRASLYISIIDPISIRNWIDDLKFFQTSFPLCSDCKVHSGFYQTYLALEAQVLNITNQYKRDHPTAKVTVTGHSLGAALAELTVSKFISLGIPVSDMYTYGTPR
jgi:predicted lipase